MRNLYQTLITAALASIIVGVALPHQAMAEYAAIIGRPNDGSDEYCFDEEEARITQTCSGTRVWLMPALTDSFGSNLDLTVLVDSPDGVVNSARCQSIYRYDFTNGGSPLTSIQFGTPQYLSASTNEQILTHSVSKASGVDGYGMVACWLNQGDRLYGYDLH